MLGYVRIQEEVNKNLIDRHLLDWYTIKDRKEGEAYDACFMDGSFRYDNTADKC